MVKNREKQNQVKDIWMSLAIKRNVTVSLIPGPNSFSFAHSGRAKAVLENFPG